MILYLSLGRDPDGQAAVIPPLVDELRLVVRLLLCGAGVEPHVVDHAMIFDIFTFRIKAQDGLGSDPSLCS